MSREILDKVNTASDRLNDALMSNELVYHATLFEPADNPHLNYGANAVSMILRDVMKQLHDLADGIRETEGLPIPKRRDAA